MYAWNELKTLYIYNYLVKLISICQPHFQFESRKHIQVNFIHRKNKIKLKMQRIQNEHQIAIKFFFNVSVDFILFLLIL